MLRSDGIAYIPWGKHFREQAFHGAEAGKAKASQPFLGQLD